MSCALRFIKYFPINGIPARYISMSAQRRAEEALKKLKDTNPFFEKYATKIAKLQATSPDEFVERIDKVTQPIKDGKSQNRTYSELLNPKQPIAEKPIVEVEPYKKLADIMKLNLVRDKSSDEIAKIWFGYHKTKDVLIATLTLQQFDTLMERARKYPVFILPLPRSEGFEFFMLQFSGNTVHFTPLLAYQVHAENAPESLTLVHYVELRDKNIILMRGEYDNKVLSATEAQCLANQMQMFYLKTNDSKLKLLETFTEQPNEFKHTDLIKEVENIELV